MTIKKDFRGVRFGSLVVVADTSPRVTTGSGKPKSQRRVRCRCDCGYTGVFRLGQLKSGRTKSCGCSRKTHGGKGTPEYTCWKGMKARCLRKTHDSYSSYGGRGIKIHPGWVNDFAAFLAYVGKRPSKKHSLDRVDVDGNYEPGNVRWATPAQQRANQRDRCPHCGRAYEKVAP